MQQIFPQLEPQNKNKPFMEQVGWQLILIVTALVAGIVGTIIVGIWQGTTHVIDFSWIVLGLLFIIFGIVAFFAWYSIRARQKLQEQHNRDIAAIKNDVLTFKNDIRRMREDEIRQWNEWAISFSAQVDKEHRERTEQLKKQYMEAIHDTESRLDGSVKNAQSMFSTAIESNRIAVDLYRQQLIHAQNQMVALEERLRKELTPDTTNQSSEVKIPPE